MLKINPSRQATRFLKKLPPKQARQVARKITELLTAPEPHDSKQMKGKDSSSSYRRADIGEYRIIYRVQGDTLKIAVVGKRNDDEVYKIFLRQ